jgi:CDGSH-type Zn-finger protein
MAIIKALQNGPYKLEGDGVTVLDGNGNAFPSAKGPIYLCRCGASKTKPFCDGQHTKVGFKAAEEAVSEVDRGA